MVASINPEWARYGSAARKIRMDYGATLKDMAEALDKAGIQMSRDMISDREKGRVAYSLPEFLAVLDVFHIGYQMFMHEVPDRGPSQFAPDDTAQQAHNPLLVRNTLLDGGPSGANELREKLPVAGIQGEEFETDFEKEFELSNA